MASIMTAIVRRALRVATRAFALLPLQTLLSLSGAGRAGADHGGPLASAPMSPALVGALAAALTLAAGILLVVIVRLLTRKTPPAE